MPWRVKPLKPSEVETKKQEALPDFVILAFNELIARKWNGEVATFTRKEATDLIRGKMGNGDDRPFSPEWLNVEPIYRQEGWKVRVEFPDPTEHYDSYYEFRRWS
jgi:hypothetical protein